MAYLQAKNRALSSLSVAMLIGDTTLTVASAVSFPTTTPFNLTMEDEIVQVTGISSNVFTVTRAQEGTTASAHALGVSVQLRITAGIIKEIQNGLTKSIAYAIAL